MEAAVLNTDEFILRTLIEKRHVVKATNQVDAKAFMRRKRPADPRGLSVNFSCTREECCRQAQTRFKEIFGIAELTVGSVRSIDSLDVIADNPQPEGELPHANIQDLPYREDNFDLAMHLATKLAFAAKYYPPATQIEGAV